MDITTEFNDRVVMSHVFRIGTARLSIALDGDIETCQPAVIKDFMMTHVPNCRHFRKAVGVLIQHAVHNNSRTHRVVFARYSAAFDDAFDVYAFNMDLVLTREIYLCLAVLFDSDEVTLAEKLALMGRCVRDWRQFVECAWPPWKHAAFDRVLAPVADAMREFVEAFVGGLTAADRYMHAGAVAKCCYTQ